MTGIRKALGEICTQVALLVFVAPFAILFLVVCVLIQIVCFPLYRIPIGRTREMTRPIRHKVIPLGNMFRDGIEEWMGNGLLFLGGGSQPQYLYVPRRELTQLPEQVTRARTHDAMKRLAETVVVTLSVRPVVLGGWSPARLIDYKVIQKGPEWGK